MSKKVIINDEIDEINEEEPVENIEDDDDDDDDEDEDEDEFDPNFTPLDIGNVLQNFFTDDNGTNVTEAILSLKSSVDTQNKILMKILNAFKDKNT